MAQKKTIVIAGAGAVGLSVARYAARLNLQTFVLEKNAKSGQETSARNSQVIHAGIYYPRDSLKASLCVRGRELLYQFCDVFHVPYERCGKLIVAQADQTRDLLALWRNGVENGVEDLVLLSKDHVRELEPQIHCAEAILSPSTGIIDSHAFVSSLEHDAEQHGAVVLQRAAVRSIKYMERAKAHEILIEQGNEIYVFEADYFVNATGLESPILWHSMQRDDAAIESRLAPRLAERWAKGTYFRLANNRCPPFHRLIYPLPEANGLGIHVTLDLEGNARFGPDVEWVDRIDYAVDPDKRSDFVKNIQSYYPLVSAEDLAADYCGIRPKIVHADGSFYQDFCIAGPAIHQVPGVVHLCGIESPGLTCALAIAEETIKTLRVG